MTYTVKQIQEWAISRNIRKNVWVPARPVVGPFVWRLKEAWLVLTGKLDTLKWEDQ